MTGNGLVGQVAIVTGSASGIGREVARALRLDGAQVWGCDLDFIGSCRQQDEALGIHSNQLDVRDEPGIQQWIEQVVRDSGRCDIVVNAAGITLEKPITEVSQDEWDHCFDVNVKGIFLVCKHAIPVMQRQGGGSIVNIASNAGLLPRAADPAYSISKHAVVALTKSLALSHSPDRIRVNAICPGPVEGTRIMDRDLAQAADPEQKRRQVIEASPLAHAHGRMIQPYEVAQAVRYFVGPGTEMVTGTSLAIDGGKSLGVPPSPKH